MIDSEMYVIPMKEIQTIVILFGLLSNTFIKMY